VRRAALILFTLTYLIGNTKPTDDTDEFVQHVFYLSEVLLHDVVNPPAASRFYAYSILAAYAVSKNADKDLPDLLKMLNVDPGIQIPVKPVHWSETFCAMYAMLDVGRQVIPSGYLLEEKQKGLIDLYKKKHKISSVDIEDNKTFAIQVASQIVKYAKSDGYSKLSTLTRYAPNADGEGHWHPTPPEYMAAVEPYWRTIRPLMIDSANQFAPRPPAPVNNTPGTPFYLLMKEVHEISLNLTAEEKAIAAFWDCNPFAVQYSGHMAIGIKKISPGGHWIGITGIASRQAKLPFGKTVFVHALVSITLFDAFISCWDEKYKSDRLRPEAAINKYIDPAWRPMLQTPPFPEYTSGHSVVSTASAEILTTIFGDNFLFTDTSEEYFGLPVRTFKSFREAANEAAISRMYGGIHFRDAIEAGQIQGRSLGLFIMQKINNEKKIGY
jgi:hypothetical protein